MAVLNEDFGAIFDTSIRFELAGITYTENNEWFTDSRHDEVAYKTALGIDHQPLPECVHQRRRRLSGLRHLSCAKRRRCFRRRGESCTVPPVAGKMATETLIRVAHWFTRSATTLGLWHTFQGNGGTCENTYTSGDYLFDTPPHGSPDFGCSAASVCGG